MVVLDEIKVNALISKLFAIPAFGKEATIVTKSRWIQQDHAGEFGPSNKVHEIAPSFSIALPLASRPENVTARVAALPKFRTMPGITAYETTVRSVTRRQSVPSEKAGTAPPVSSVTKTWAPAPAIAALGRVATE